MRLSLVLWPLISIACAHPMHVDAEPGAKVYVDGAYVGDAPVDVDVQPGVDDILLNVEDRGKSVTAHVKRQGIGKDTVVSAIVAGTSTAAVTAGATTIAMLSLEREQRLAAQDGDYGDSAIAGILLYVASPVMIAASLVLTATAVTVPILAAGDEPPTVVHVDVETDSIRY